MEKINYISPILWELGRRIKLARLIKRMSQAKLAFSCDMEKSTISKIESGMINIGFLSLDRICKCLDVTVCELTDNKTPA